MHLSVLSTRVVLHLLSIFLLHFMELLYIWTSYGGHPNTIFVFQFPHGLRLPPMFANKSVQVNDCRIMIFRAAAVF